MSSSERKRRLPVGRGGKGNRRESQSGRKIERTRERLCESEGNDSAMVLGVGHYIRGSVRSTSPEGAWHLRPWLERRAGA